MKQLKPIARTFGLLSLAVGAAVTLTSGLGAQTSPPSSLPAFPGAEGFGAMTPGGRGGR